MPRPARHGRRPATLTAALAVGVMSLGLAGCEYKAGPTNPMNVPWSTDMYVQPSLYPQEAPIPPAPPNTTPVNAEPPALPHMVAARQLKNPVPMTGASVKRGEALYGTFCVPCHGARGKGDGPVSAKFVPPPPLDGPAARGRTDGYIYATIRQGSLSTIMPAYGYRLSELERWDLVNYVRHLQGVVVKGAGEQPGKEAMTR